MWKKKVLLRDTRDTHKKKKPGFAILLQNFFFLMLAEQEAPNIFSTKRGTVKLTRKDKVQTLGYARKFKQPNNVRQYVSMRVQNLWLGSNVP